MSNQAPGIDFDSLFNQIPVRTPEAPKLPESKPAPLTALISSPVTDVIIPPLSTTEPKKRRGRPHGAKTKPRDNSAAVEAAKLEAETYLQNNPEIDDLGAAAVTAQARKTLHGQSNDGTNPEAVAALFGDESATASPLSKVADQNPSINDIPGGRAEPFEQPKSKAGKKQDKTGKEFVEQLGKGDVFQGGAEALAESFRSPGAVVDHSKEIPLAVPTPAKEISEILISALRGFVREEIRHILSTATVSEEGHIISDLDIPF